MKSPRRLARWIGLGVIAALLYAIFLVTMAPASMLARAVTHFGQGFVTLQQPTGSIWKGSALFSAPRISPTPLGTVHWSFDLLPLLIGKLGASFRLTGSEYEGSGVVRAGFGDYALRDVALVFPAQNMASVYAPARLLRPSGRLRFTATTLELDSDGLRGTAKLAWEQAGTGLPQLPQLGDYLVDLDAKGERADVRVTTARGPILVTAQGDWSLLGDGALQVQGNVRPSNPQPALDAMLRNLGPKQPDGSHSFTFRTNLPISAFL